MAKYADVLEDLVRNHGLTNVRWAEGRKRAELRRAASVTLERVRRARTGRWTQQLRRPRPPRPHPAHGRAASSRTPAAASRTHYVWMQWIAANMGDIFDAWARARVLVLQRRRTPRVPAPGRLAPPQRGAAAGAAEADLHDGVRHPRHRDVRRRSRRSRTRTTREIRPVRRSGARTSPGSSSSGSRSGRRSSGITGAAKWDAYWGRVRPHHASTRRCTGRSARRRRARR